jgi:Holliday junction resolvase
MSGRASTKRGRRFETEIAELLRTFGFEVPQNAKTARPRQTDIFASSGGIDLLIETKDRKRTIDVADIDALRSRLNRVAHDIVGVIFTTSKLTREAIKSIESDRQREVIVFVRQEIERIRRGEQSLSTLLDRKRKELRVGGRAWFGLLLRLEYIDVKLPIGTIEFKVRNKVSSYFESKSNFSGACFALQIPDPGWGSRAVKARACLSI